MQVIPALPWEEPEEGGKIRLKEAVTIEDLNDQAVVVILSNGGSYYEAKWEAIDATHIELKVSNTVLYSAKLSEDGKTIGLYGPQPSASNYLIYDVIVRDGVKLYPSFPLQHGNSALLILPRVMGKQEIQDSLYPLIKNVQHGDQNLGGWDVYPSDNKLYIVSSYDGQGELCFVANNVITTSESTVYTSLNLQSYIYNDYFNLVDVIETPSTPLMVPTAPWGASIEEGDVILPEPMTFDDIKNGALVFATDYEVDGTHYDNFSIVNQGERITLQMGVNRAFDITSWNGARSVIRLQRAAGYESAPLTAVRLLDSIFIRPGTPWNNNVNEGLVRLPYEANMENVEDDFKFLSTQVVNGEYQYFDIRVTRDDSGWVENVYLAYNGVDIYSLEYTTRGNNTLITFTKIAPSATVFLQAVEEIQALPVQGDVQIFTSNRCTKLATGEVSVVYARINKTWTEPWEVGTEQGNSFNAMSEQYGSDCVLWNVFLSANSWPNYVVGDVIEFDSTRGWVDVTNFTKVFTKPA